MLENSLDKWTTTAFNDQTTAKPGENEKAVFQSYQYSNVQISTTTKNHKTYNEIRKYGPLKESK